MGEKISLLMAIHCHQPVGNFDGVFAHAYEKSYLPFIEVLERHPNIRLSLHYTGPLLEWLELNRPEFLDRIRKLVEKGQVEILSGGFYEPILTLLREEDAIEQVKIMTNYVESKFLYKAKGAWLAERIWEPKVPLILNKAGIEFTIVDDSHFASVGRDVETLDGYYVSEDEGKKVFVFPTSEKLRYYMPFKLPQETIDYLWHKKEEGFLGITFGDDGEKFGLWPGTYKWVYEEHWLDNFFSAVENSDWIETITFSEFIGKYSASGNIYLPCVSYREMLEWSGGYFRNFMIKYPESNRMHKRMLSLSKSIEFLSSEHQAKRYLYKSQCNCGYWHGVFGGLYLNHLRSAIYSNIILSELASGMDWQAEKVDLDFNGKDEVILRSQNQNLFLSHYGTIFEWDYKDKAVNISNVLTRRYEPYHEKLSAKPQKGCNPNEVQSIHDITTNNVKDLSVLKYDKYLRESFVGFFVKPDAAIEDFYCHEHLFGKTIFVSDTYLEGDTALCFKTISLKEGQMVNIKTNISLDSAKIHATIEFDSDTIDSEATFGLEFNFSLFDETLSSKKGFIKDFKKELWFKDKWYGINIRYRADKDFNVVHYPVETVSESEQGMETTYQGSCVILLWKINPKSSVINLEIEIG